VEAFRFVFEMLIIREGTRKMLQVLNYYAYYLLPLYGQTASSLNFHWKYTGSKLNLFAIKSLIIARAKL